MKQKRYIFQCTSDETLEMPVGSNSSYNAVQELKKLVGEITEWRLVKIIETTLLNRSISSIESDYLARQPRYRRDK